MRPPVDWVLFAAANQSSRDDHGEPDLPEMSLLMAEMTEEQRKQIDALATSISKLCHAVIAKRLGQFFEVVGDEIAKMENDSRDASTDKIMNDVHKQVGPITEFTTGNDTARAQLDARIEKLTKALRFIKELSSEVMENGDVKVGTAAEIAVRHIWRRAKEALPSEPG